MELQRIFDSINSHIDNNTLLFCDEALGIGGTALSGFLTNAFGSPVLMLDEVCAALEMDAILLKAVVSQDGQGAVFDTSLRVVADDLYICITLQINGTIEMDFAESIHIPANRVKKEYHFLLCNNALADYEVSGDITEVFTLLDMLHLIAPEFQSPFPNIELKGIRLLSKTQYQFGGISQTYGASSLSRLELTKNIAIQNFGIAVTSRNQLYELAISGTIDVAALTIPLILRLKQGGFLFGLSTGADGVMLPSLNSIAHLVGTNLSTLLPESFSSLGGLCLKTLCLTFGDGFVLQSFSTRLETTSRWEFLGIKGLSLSDVILSFQAVQSQKELRYSGSIEGVLNIGSFGVYLCAKRSAGGHYTLSGGMPKHKTLNLASIAKAFCELLGFPAVASSIPDIILSNVLLTFATGSKTFDAYLSVDIGNHQESPLSVSYLVNAFGVSDVPEAVEALGIKCNTIFLSYSFSKKAMKFEVVNAKYGTLSFHIAQDTSRHIQFMTKITFLSLIPLSKLPVVGTSLHLLNDISLNALTVSAATADCWPDVKKGIRIQGILKFFQTEEAFELNLAGQFKHAFSDAANSGSTKWFVLNKSLSLLHLQRIGLNYRNGSVGFLLDATLSANPVEIGLMGLGLGFSMSDVTKISFYLSGLSIRYQNPSLSISGAFLKDADNCYSGMLTVQMKSLSITAVGSYEDDSLYAYAVLRAPLGGSPAFFITGFAAGFGYNQSIAIPGIEHVNTFPMVKAAFGNLSPEEMLSGMKQICSFSKGCNFIAAGIKFTSFKMVDSFALATITFGKRLEAVLLGLSEIDIPKGGRNITPIAHAQLALRAVYTPDDGYFSAMAQLTPESYVLSKDCHLTGGFAFCVWFDGLHKGDFVITLGGYHRMYQKPLHYPDVPRLGFLWNVTKELKLSGSLYFALTPHCIMVGGELSAVYQSGELRAWFEARADFIISWKPYYYDIRLYIGLGASYRLNLLFCKVTLKVELSADLQIWGPDFSGKARITWFIISFTISFGASGQTKKYIDWTEFEQSFLPHAKSASVSSANESEALIGGTIEIMSGKQGESMNRTAIVNPEQLKVSFKTTVPCTEINVNGTNFYKDTREIGVLPMGEGKRLLSSCVITLRGVEDADVIYEHVPSALWGMHEHSGAELIPDVAMGVTLSPKHNNTFDTLPAAYFLDLKKLIEYDKIEKEFLWVVPAPIIGPSYHEEHSIERFRETVMKPDVRTRRSALLEGFRKSCGYQLDSDIHLETFAKEANEMLYEAVGIVSVV